MHSNLARNLKKLMTKIAISESALARKTEINQPVINNLVNGNTTNPNINTLRPLAKFFKVSIDQLIGDEALDTTNDELQNEKILNNNWANIPISSWEVADITSTINKNAVDTPHFISLDNKPLKELFALRIEDIAMEPTFLKGAIIIVNPALKPSDQDYVVILLNKQKKAVLRQILFNGENLFFKSLNTDFGGLQTPKDFKILGVVTETHSYFK